MCDAVIICINWKTPQVQVREHFFSGDNVKERVEAVLWGYNNSENWSDWTFHSIFREEQECQDS